MSKLADLRLRYKDARTSGDAELMKALAIKMALLDADDYISEMSEEHKSNVAKHDAVTRKLIGVIAREKELTINFFAVHRVHREKLEQRVADLEEFLTRGDQK